MKQAHPALVMRVESWQLLKLRQPNPKESEQGSVKLRPAVASPLPALHMINATCFRLASINFHKPVFLIDFTFILFRSLSSVVLIACVPEWC